MKDIPLKGYADSLAPTAEQRTAQWLAERIGHCTASKFGDVLDITKSGNESAKRRNYRLRLVVERITGQTTPNFVSAAMQWGTETEAQARMAYEAHTGRMVSETGFIHHTALPLVGGSPDGLVEENGGIEIKCPFESAVHLTTILNDDMPSEHIPQVQGLMWITGRAWWDFVSYDPRVPDGLNIYLKRIARDVAYIDKLEQSVILFNSEVAEQVNRLKAIAQQNSPSAQDSSAAPLGSGQMESLIGTQA